MPEPKIIQFPLGLRENLQYHFTGKINISTAEILALNATPQILVAAPGVGQMLVPITLVIVYNYGTITYATNTTIALTNDSGDELGQDNAVLLEVADYESIGAIPAFPRRGRINESIKIRVNIGNPTAGNGNLDVYLWYINLEL